jgi:hypothetical protein
MLWLESLYRQAQLHRKAQLMLCLCHWALAPVQPEGYPAEVPPLSLTQLSACVCTVSRVYELPKMQTLNRAGAATEVRRRAPEIGLW